MSLYLNEKRNVCLFRHPLKSTGLELRGWMTTIQISIMKIKCCSVFNSSTWDAHEQASDLVQAITHPHVC